MAIIPEATIDEIRSRADIVAVIGEHVQLRKAGRNWKGLCPFHGEKSPSFNVSPDRGFFYCFGCQKKGDVFTFVMEYQGKGFGEAAEQLAARFGVELPRVEESPEQRRARGERAAMLAMCKVATTFFRDTLAHPQHGAAARAYLATRGTDDATAARFQLGYAPAAWGALADHLKADGQDLELALRLGLVAARPSGGYYDRFRDRLVCPVIVPGGDVVGFSARVIAAAPKDEPNPPPKYINSPESTIYKKGRLLFGLAQARDALGSRKRALLVEGNFDVVTLHQAGLTETVAPLGTALTPEQVDALRRLTEEVVLCYDGDRAGKAATRAALETLIAADVPTRVVALPDGDDPDALVRRDGGAELTRRIKAAPGGIEFLCFEVWGRSGGTADGRATALDEASRLLRKVGNPTKRELLVGTLATALGVEVDVVMRSIGRAAQADQRGRGGHDRSYDRRDDRGSAPTGSTAPSEAAPQGPSGRPQPPAPHHEIELVALLADHPQLLSTPDADRAFSLLTDVRLRAICSAARQGQSFLELAAALLPDEIAAAVLSGRYADHSQPASQLAIMADHLGQSSTATHLQTLQQRMKDAQRRGDRDEERRLAIEMLTTRKQPGKQVD